MTFQNLLDNLEKRTKEYLLNEDVLELSMLLLGFSLSDHAIEEYEKFFFNHFNKYVNDYYFDDKANYTWESILILHSSGDKRIALEKFFEIH